MACFVLYDTNSFFVLYNAVMKKNAPKILAVVLLSLVVVLMIVAGSGSLKEVFSPTGSSDDNVPVVDAALDNDIQAKPDDTLENDEVEDNAFPIYAKTDSLNRYTQELKLTSPILNEVHSTSTETFIIFTHATQSGALKVTKTSQTIIKVDDNGNILSAYSITAPKETEYLCSQITNAGLVVAVKDDTRTYLYTISCDFKQVDLIELSLFNKGSIFALNEGVLFLGSSKENAVYKIVNNSIVASNSLQSGEIKEIYDFSTHYVLFLSNINGYSFMKLLPDLKLVSSVNMVDKTLLSVEPIVEDNKQKYMAVEQSSLGVEIVKYDANFSTHGDERVGVGLAENAKVFFNGESVFLILYSTSVRLYLVDNDLNFTSSNSTTFQGLTEFYDGYSYKGGYAVLYDKGQTLTLTDVRNDGMMKSVNLDSKVSIARIGVNGNNSFFVVYSTENELGILGIN